MTKPKDQFYQDPSVPKMPPPVEGESDKMTDDSHDSEYAQMLTAIGHVSGLLIKATDWKHVINDVLEATGKANGASRVFILKSEQRHEANEDASVNVNLGKQGDLTEQDQSNNAPVTPKTRKTDDSEFVRCAMWPVLSEPDELFDQLGVSEEKFDDVVLGYGKAQLQAGNIVTADSNALKLEGGELLQAMHVEGVLSAGIFVNGTFWGAIVCHHGEENRTWSIAQIQLVETVAKLLGSAISDTRNRDLNQVLHEAILARMKSSGTELTAVIQALPDLYFRMAIDGTIWDYHQGQKDTLYVEPARFLGKQMAKMLPEPVASEFAQALKNVNETGKLTSIEYLLPIDGKDHLFDGRLFPVLEDQVVFLIRDITDQRAAEIAMRDSERLATIGTFASGIAHEINNPLGAIVMAVHAASKAAGQNNTEMVQMMLAQIRKDTERSAQIVTNVLHFARHGSSAKTEGDLITYIEAARLGALDDDASNLPTIALERMNQTQAQDAVYINANALEIEQVFLNVFHNAIQADAKSIRVEITVNQKHHHDKPGHVTISVIDDGHGMEQQVLRHAIDPFFTARPNQGGTGLGLSLCHGMLVAHGGTLTLESQVDAGTQVTIRLPLAPVE